MVSRESSLLNHLVSYGLPDGQDALVVLTDADEGIVSNLGSTLMALSSDARLEVREHQIHRFDKQAEGLEEKIISTLRLFTLRVALCDAEHNILNDADGQEVHATLIYEDGTVVEEKSVSGEPPMLSGTATLNNGEATFKMRITVLSSLLANKKFRVHIALAQHPHIAVDTDVVKTITKTRRGPRRPSAAAAAAAHAIDDADDDDELSSHSPLPRAVSAAPDAFSSVALGRGGGGAPTPTTKRDLSGTAPDHPAPKALAQGRTGDGDGDNYQDALSPLSPLCENQQSRAKQPSAEMATLRRQVQQQAYQIEQLAEQQAMLFQELRAMRKAADQAAAQHQER